MLSAQFENKNDPRDHLGHGNPGNARRTGFAGDALDQSEHLCAGGPGDPDLPERQKDNLITEVEE